MDGDTLDRSIYHDIIVSHGNETTDIILDVTDDGVLSSCRTVPSHSNSSTANSV